ncbi:MAG: S8 family serine peptidase, partial [Actinomycetota bacterium]
MPVFSVGDNTGHSPGDMGIASIPELEQSASYSTGATDSNDVKAAFSPEVKTTDSCPLQSKDQVRPNILAPGVDIYSSVPQGAGPSALYVSKSGTSMAAAHVSGASALMLEAAGGAGSITTNDYKLDGHLNASATTTVTGCTLTCRRLDVFAAVQRVRKDGILQGRVTYMDGLTERGLANAKISAFPASGLARITYSDANGNYILRKLDGVYTVEVRGPVTVVGGNVIGWIRQRITGVTIGSKDTVVRNFQMQRAPNRPLDGDVLRYASGDAAAGVTVRLEGTPLTATTNSVGHFTFSAVPDPSIPDPALGDSTTDYELVTDGDRCSDLKRQSIIINGSLMTNDLPNTLQIVRALRRDTFGYYCVEKPIDYIAGTSPLNLRGDDEFGEVAIPFTFPFYGIARNSVFISTNGFARFDSGSSEFGNTGLPNAVSPNAAAYPFWDDLTMDSRSSILTTTTADSFVVEWRRMTFAPGFFDRITFTMTLHRNGDIEFQYKQVDNATRPKGTSATIGLENHKGDDAFQYSNAEAIVQTGKSILFSPALQVGVVRGTVRGLSAEAVPFARVTAISETDSVPRTVTADA